jgi:hypothetical protein
MPDGMYNVVVLISPECKFSVIRAIELYQSFGWKCELATDGSVHAGFRVFFGDWAIVAWFESGPSVLIGSRDDAETYLPLPAPAEVIAGCDRRLTFWSDKDPEFSHTNDWISTIRRLVRAFPPMFVLDEVVGEWW